MLKFVTCSSIKSKNTDLGIEKTTKFIVKPTRLIQAGYQYILVEVEDEIAVLLEIHTDTLNSRRCSQLKAKVRATRFHANVSARCLGKKERTSRKEARKLAFSDVRSAIASGRLRQAAKQLKKLSKVYPHAAMIYQLEYELRRAEQQKAEEKLSALRYAGRLQSIEKRLPALEDVCSRSVREYRRTRKRMRLALRQGQDGRAARLRINHDRAFFRACGARDQVVELLEAQVTTGLVQAVRVTRESAPTCLKQWTICDRNP